MAGAAQWSGMEINGYRPAGILCDHCDCHNGPDGRDDGSHTFRAGLLSTVATIVTVRGLSLDDSAEGADDTYSHGRVNKGRQTRVAL